LLAGVTQDCFVWGGHVVLWRDGVAPTISWHGQALRVVDGTLWIHGVGFTGKARLFSGRVESAGGN
jgi:hypothetical protein